MMSLMRALGLILLPLSAVLGLGMILGGLLHQASDATIAGAIPAGWSPDRQLPRPMTIPPGQDPGNFCHPAATIRRKVIQ